MNLEETCIRAFQILSDPDDRLQSRSGRSVPEYDQSSEYLALCARAEKKEAVPWHFLQLWFERIIQNENDLDKKTIELDRLMDLETVRRMIHFKACDRRLMHHMASNLRRVYLQLRNLRREICRKAEVAEFRDVTAMTLGRIARLCADDLEAATSFDSKLKSEFGVVIDYLYRFARKSRKAHPKDLLNVRDFETGALVPFCSPFAGLLGHDRAADTEMVAWDREMELAFDSTDAFNVTSFPIKSRRKQAQDANFMLSLRQL